MKIFSFNKIFKLTFFLNVMILFFILFQQSCKKSDFAQNVNVTEKFLTLPADASPLLKKIAARIKEQNDQKPFIEEFVKREGFPVWEHATVKISNTHSQAQSIGRENTIDDDTLVSIPFVILNAEFVKCFLDCKINNDILFKLFNAEEYAAFGFDKNPVRQNPNADDIVKKLMLFEREIFGDDIFKIMDTRLFDYWLQNTTVPDAFFLRADDPEGDCEQWFETVSSDGGLTWTDTGVSWWEGNCEESGGGGGGGGIFIGWNDWPNGTGWGIFVPPGGVGGGGGIYIPIPGNGTGGCDRGWFRIDPAFPNPCGAEIPNVNGFLPSRITFLQNYLNENPLGVTSCNELASFASYGYMFQNVAQYTPPPYIITRLNAIRAAQPIWIIDNYNLQSLEDAYGPSVNCDFFPIQITQFPLNYATGQRLTPKEFLEYFRLNINSFITSPVTVNFSCSFGPSFDDCTKWNDPYENSIGALNHIYIPGNSGSVIISDYQHINNSTTGSDKYQFKFSTLETPFDYEHPVAGTREFGIYNTGEHLDKFTFYTMGVDRTWDLQTAVLNDIFAGFERADELWSNIQQNVKTFVTEHGGVASYYSQQKIIARPKWNDVKEYLRGEITFVQLKNRLDCP